MDDAAMDRLKRSWQAAMARRAPAPLSERSAVSVPDPPAMLVDRALHSLTPREETVIRQRYEARQTFAAIGVLIGRTRQTAHRVHAKALRKLCHPMRARHLTRAFR